ncbi:TSUP family transporter [Acidianus sulfidivorans JP7]|uniref:Probable membrane transporter protein n=1 Tax=Acidianus sulfidivorans JP7 TaxID=619593 RepID=A0A2U9IL48_9CREN|nr:sulfite exporter TauE/SafE family protein [Acidianus sulfidivorans]AWR96746.1 TSUP family transporter [Acidianus sulfidivorans JP7]
MLLVLLLELFISSIIAGLLGSLTGLGGGVVLTPILVLFLGVPIEYAIGASLISTIATSASSGSRYLRTGLAHMRVGISLEIATTTGAVTGSILEYYIERAHLFTILDVLFGAILIFSVMPNFVRMGSEIPEYSSDPKPDLAYKLRLYGEYYDQALDKKVKYRATRYPAGLFGMYIAGLVSGLLGIGSGALKVLAMDLGMNLPFKITTATSSFMIGVTAATSSGVYWALGIINPIIVGMTIPGVFIGSNLGSRYLNRLLNRRLRQIFTLVLLALGIQLILRGLGIF